MKFIHIQIMPIKQHINAEYKTGSTSRLYRKNIKVNTKTNDIKRKIGFIYCFRYLGIIYVNFISLSSMLILLTL